MRRPTDVNGERPRPTEGLTITESGQAKIAERGYRLEDAQMVWERSPFWVWQGSRLYRDESGRIRGQRPRWRMVGRGPEGVILSVILELPRPNGTSEVVSIYEASPMDQSRYHEWARRHR